MDDYIKKLNNMHPEFDVDNLVDFTDDTDFSDTVENVISEGTATQSGNQTVSLQAAMDNYANAMNQSAIAKSTGLPVRTGSQQYKGFIAEEFFKHTLKINALADGIPDWKIGVYTNGELPDGGNLSPIDEHTDISVWLRNHPWDKAVRTVDYQSKIFNDAGKYADVFNSPKYKDVEHVGGAGQGVNDKVRVQIGGKTVSSDSITPDKAVEAADQAKAQATPEYSQKQEKFDKLHHVTLGRAVAAGAASGLIFSTIQEVISVLRNSKDLPEDQFIHSVENILCGTVDGGVRGGAIAGSVQIFSKMMGREIAANSLEAVPIMAGTNVAVSFAKDLYKCFVVNELDKDDLLCNTVNNTFSSAAGFGGAWVGGQIGGQTVTLFTAAKSAAATGAAIGSPLGPIGTVVGSLVGGLLIGLGTNAIVGTANKDAQHKYLECINEIETHIELEGFDKLYYFADSMESLSNFRVSFKDLLPCYNLISDLKEYSLHKKALRSIENQLQKQFSQIDAVKYEGLKQLEEQHNNRIVELRASFDEQKETMVQGFWDSVNNYVTDSYTQYLGAYEVITDTAHQLLEQYEDNRTKHSYILSYCQHRKEVNEELNNTLNELMQDSNDRDILLPFIDKMQQFMQQDRLLIGRQYISFEEAITVLNGGVE